MEEQKQQQIQPEKQTKKLEGFGGWLALLAIGIIMNPIRLILDILQQYQATGFDTISYIINIILLTLSVILVYLLLSRKKSFKKWYLAVVIISLLISGLGLLGVNAEPNLYTNKEVMQTMITFWGSLGVAIVWPTYLWRSKRVKNTFIK